MQKFNENIVPGSGVTLSDRNLLALSGIEMVSHQMEAIGGHFTPDPNITICLIVMHAKVRTPEGLKDGDLNLTYQIERFENAFTVTPCKNGRCPK